jgi:hypothetical protein
MATPLLTIITDALLDLNVIAEGEEPSAAQGKHALRQLNNLMDTWREESKDIGYFAQDNVNSTIPIPDWSKIGVTAALAIVIAPKYGATVSQELVAKADFSEALIIRKCMLEKMTGANMDHMPRGSGILDGSYNITTDN